MYHKPVLYNEVLKYLVTKKSGFYFDGTAGFGGHSEGILNRLNDDGNLVITDVDKDAFEFIKSKFQNDDRVKYYNYNFSKIDLIAKIESIEFFDGIFADLGVSSFQLDNAESGFTYRSNAKLDLRLDKNIKINAADVINSFSEEDLADIFFKYGEERKSRKIARLVCEKRKIKKIETTTELAEIISEAVPYKNRTSSLSRIFQALRIYINDELEVLKSFLNKSVDLLSGSGRIVILTYHSLEDRIVKEIFKYETLDCICPKGTPVCVCDKEKRLNILTKKPVTPSEEEIKMNPRARSAKLRAAEKI